MKLLGITNELNDSTNKGAPRWRSGKESACQCRSARDEVQSLSQEVPLKEETAAYFNILAWKIPRAEEPGRLQPMGYKESDTTKHACTYVQTKIKI